MKWEGGRQSSNVEDRRGKRVPRGVALGGGATVVIAIVVALMGGDLNQILSVLTGGQGGAGRRSQSASAPEPKHHDKLAKFTSVVLADTEDTWPKLLQAVGKRYEEPKLVLYRDVTRSACGTNSSAVGPFYCPGDRKIYIDLSFFDDLSRRFKAPGDFAQAYVLAHEVGHHVQNLLGQSGKVHRAKRGLSKAQANRLSVKLELQADCYAGLWAHHANRSRQILEQGDIAEALKAAAAIGDDRLQQQSRGKIVPESFTHGTSAQRMEWFNIGLKAGRLAACDTFR